MMIIFQNLHLGLYLQACIHKLIVTINYKGTKPTNINLIDSFTLTLGKSTYISNSLSLKGIVTFFYVGS